MPVTVDDLATMGSGQPIKKATEKSVPNKASSHTPIQTIDDLANLGSGEPLKKKATSENSTTDISKSQSTPQVEETDNIPIVNTPPEATQSKAQETSRYDFNKQNSPFGTAAISNTVDITTPSGAKIQIDKTKIPVLNKDAYISDLQNKVASGKHTPFDEEIIATSSNKSPAAVKAYLKGDNKTGSAVDQVDLIQKNRNDLRGIILDYNTKNGANINPDQLLANPEKLSLWVQSYQKQLQAVINANTGHGMFDPMTKHTDPSIKDRTLDLLNKFNTEQKPLINEHLSDAISLLDLPEKEKVKQIQQLINPAAYVQTQKALNKANGTNANPIDVISSLVDELKNTKKQDDETLNSLEGYGYLALNDAYRRISNGKAAVAFLNKDDAMMQDAKRIADKIDDNVIKQYPSILKSQMIDKIAHDIAEKQGFLNDQNNENTLAANASGYARKLINPFSSEITSNQVKEAVIANGWDKDPDKKEMADWIINNPGQIKGASIFGGFTNALLEPVKNLFTGVLDFTGVRNQRDIMVDKTNEQLFPKEFNPEETNAQFNILGTDFHARSTVNSIAGLTGMTAITLGTGGIGRAVGLGLDAAETAELASEGISDARKAELLGKVASISEHAGSYTSFAIPSIDPNIKASYGNPNITNDIERAAFVTMGAILNGEGGRLLNLGGFGKVVEPEFVTLVKGISEKTITEDAAKEVLKKGEKKFVDYVVKYGKPIAITAGQSGVNALKGAATMAYFTAGQKILQMGFKDPNAKAEDLLPEAGHAFVDGLFTMIPFGFVQAVGSPEKNPNSSMKGQLFNMALFPDATQDIFKLGKKSDADYNYKMKVLNTAVSGKNMMEAAATDQGVSLNTAQKSAFVANHTIEAFLREKADKIDGTDEKSKKAEILGQADEVRQQNADIMDGLQLTKSLEPLYDLYHAEKNYDKAFANFQVNGNVENQKAVEESKGIYTDLVNKYHDTKYGTTIGALPSDNKKAETFTIDGKPSSRQEVEKILKDGQKEADKYDIQYEGADNAIHTKLQAVGGTTENNITTSPKSRETILSEGVNDLYGRLEGKAPPHFLDPLHKEGSIEQLQNQALTTPNSIKNALKSEPLTVELIARNTTEDINNQILKLKESIKGEEVDKQTKIDVNNHIDLLKKGLEKKGEIHQEAAPIEKQAETTTTSSDAHKDVESNADAIKNVNDILESDKNEFNKTSHIAGAINDAIEKLSTDDKVKIAELTGDKKNAISRNAAGIHKLSAEYAKAKVGDTNPELVAAVEQALTPKQESKGSDVNSELDKNNLQVIDNDGEFLVGNYKKESSKNPSMIASKNEKGQVERFKTKEEANARLTELKSTPKQESIAPTVSENKIKTKGTIRIPSPYGSGKDFAELPRVLIRMGDAPVDEKGNVIASSAYAAGKKAGQQEGVAVFEAGYDPRTGHFVIDSGNEALTLSLQEAILQKRKLFVVDGKELPYRGEDFEVQIDPKTYKVQKEIHPDNVVEDASSGDLETAISGKELGENFPKYWTYEDAQKQKTAPTVSSEVENKENNLNLQNDGKDNSQKETIGTGQDESGGNSSSKPVKEKSLIEKVRAIEDVIDPYDRVLPHFANDGKIHGSAIEKVFGGKDARIRQNASTENERRSRISLIGKDAPTINQLAHKLWEEDKTEKYTTMDYKDAIERVITDYNSKAQMQKDLVAKYDYEEAAKKYYEQHTEPEAKEATEIVGGLSDEEINHILEMEADKSRQEEMDNYIQQLSEKNKEDISSQSKTNTNGNNEKDGETGSKGNQSGINAQESGSSREEGNGKKEDVEKTASNPKGAASKESDAAPPIETPKEEPPANADSEEWASVRKEKLKEIEGVKEMFSKRLPKKWNQIYKSALENLQKMYPKKSLYDAMRSRVNEFALRLNNKELFNPTSEDIAVFTTFRAETDKRLNAVEGQDSESSIVRQVANMEIASLKQDLVNIARVTNPEGEAGRAFGMHQSEAQLDENNGLKIRRMELMDAKGGDPLTPEEEKWTNDMWEKEKEIAKKKADLERESLQQDFDNKIEELKKQYEAKLKEASANTSKKTPTEKTLSQKGKEVADRLRQLKKPKGGTAIDFTLGTWDLAVEGIAKLVEGGATIAEAIQKLLKDGVIGFKEEKDRTEFEKYIAEGLGSRKEKSKVLNEIKDYATENEVTDVTNEMVGKNLIRDYVESHIGEVDQKDLLNTAFEDLKKVLPDLTKEKMVEAYLKENEFKQPTKKDVEGGLAEAKKQLKSIAKLTEDIEDLQRLKDLRQRTFPNERAKSEFEKKLFDEKNAKIKEISDRNNRIREENARLESERNRQLKKISDLAEKKLKLENGIVEKTAARQKAIDTPEIEKLKSEVRQIEKDIREAESAKKAAERKIESDRNRQIKSDNKKIETEVNRQLTKIQELNDKKDKLENGIREKRSVLPKADTPEIERLKKEVNETDKNLRESESLAKKMFKEIQDKKDKLDELNANIERAKNDRDLIKTHRNKSEAEIDEEIAAKQKELKKAVSDNSSEERVQEKLLQKAIDISLKRRKEFERRLRENDFSEPELPKKLTKKSGELIRINKETAEIEGAYRNKQNDLKEHSKSGIQRGLEFGRNLVVAAMIGAPKTLVKVGGSAVLRPMMEGVRRQSFGRIYDLFFPSISKVAERGGESKSWSSLKKGYESYFRQYSEKQLEDKYTSANKEYEDAKGEYDKYKNSQNPSEKKLTDLKNKMNDKLIKVQGSLIFKFLGGSSIKDALTAFVNRSNIIEREFGHLTKESIKDGDWLDKANYVVGMIGRSHSAAKTFSGRFSFAASFMARLEGAVRNGEDITHPNKILEIANESYLDWERGKYQQSNIISDLWSEGINKLGSSGKDLKGIVAGIAKLIAQTDVAITRVPVNMLHEAVMEYTAGAFRAIAMSYKVEKEARKEIEKDGFTNGQKEIEGVVYGTTKAEFNEALRNQINKLDETQAATIARCFSKGGLGVGFYALALITAAIHFGIFPHMGQKKKKDEKDLKPDELNPGQVMFGNTKLGETLSGAIEHNTALYPMFMGLSIAQQYNDNINNGLSTASSAASDIMTHLKVVQDQIPQTKYFNPIGAIQKAGQLFKKRAEDSGLISSDNNLLSKEQLKSDNIKFLQDKGVKLPQTGTPKQHKVDVDKEHPNGVMKYDESQKFNELRRQLLEKNIDEVLNSSYKIKVKDTEGNVEEQEVSGRDLSTEQLDSQIKSATTKANQEALKEMQLKIEKSKTTVTKIKE